MTRQLEPSQARRFAREQAVSAVVSRLGLTPPEAAEALGEAHDVVWEYLAPFVVQVANDMIEDIRAEVVANPTRRIVFLGRDGHSLAIATRALEPDLYDRHCCEVVLSRVVVESALQDLERNSGRSFPDISDFRRAAAKVAEDDISGARARLADYLQRSGVPVGTPGSAITLVDTSFKGTIQECLAAIYPGTAFDGRYVFFGASPKDPHPGSKRGYALHLEVPLSNGGRPVADLGDDPELTFACQDAVGAVEETLNGSLPSPHRLSDGHPVQHFSDADVSSVEGLNPWRVADKYRDPSIRRAVKQLNLVAVKQYADEVVERRARGEMSTDRQFERAGEFRSQVRCWIQRNGPDPRLARMLDSFARRSDREVVRRLTGAVHSLGLTSDQARRVWNLYDMHGTFADKEGFVERFSRDPQGVLPDHLRDAPRRAHPESATAGEEPADPAEARKETVLDPDDGARRTAGDRPQRRPGPSGFNRRRRGSSPVRRDDADRGRSR